MKFEEQLILKWSDFQTNVEKSFRDVRYSQEFSDVTLVCEDYETQSHRFILSSGSHFFQEVLQRSKHPHPLIYLKGIWKTELEAVLEFLYHGETKVSQESLTKFIRTAKDLKIKGVLDEEESNLEAEESLSNLTNSQDTSEKFYQSETKTQTKKQSEAWMFFERNDKDSATCRVCRKVLKTKCGATTGLWTHMNVHPSMSVHPYGSESSKKDIVRKEHQEENILETEQNIPESLSETSRHENIDNNPSPQPRAQKTSSQMWFHFSKIEKDLASCHICGKLIRCLNGCTTGLWTHMKSIHAEVITNIAKT